MAHAVVIQVKIDPNADVVHRHAILADFVLPEVRSLPGFERGMWMNDGEGVGTCVVVFETEEDARSALAPLTAPGGPEVISSGIHEVEIEA